jgi:prepilin peptidase CpaA
MHAHLETIITAAAIIYVLAVAHFDLRSHRIPNLLCATALITGLCLQASLHGWQGVGIALGGAAVGLCMFLPFYVLRAFGAGDVKAMAAAGAFLGTQLTVLGVAFTLIAGSLIGVVVLWLSAASPAAAFYRLIAVVAAPISFVRGTMSSDAARRGQRFPYGAAIAAGVLAALFWSGRLQPLFGIG